MYISKNERQTSLFNLIKIAAKKSEDLDALRKIFVLKYPGERAAQGFAIQYYNKFIRSSDPSVNLTEENLPQPLPQTIEEIKLMLQSVETVKAKTKKEEFIENLISKYPDVDLTNLNEDYLSWLHQRYFDNNPKPEEIVHPIEVAMETLRKFPSIQAKYKASPELKNKINNAGYGDISSIKNLTIDDMERMIVFDNSDLTVKVEGVEIKDGEFLGKFGEWNLWLPHTKETSVKIAGYDEKYNPKTTWCTARTRGSNLFYNYTTKKDAPVFLFYIIKDNPKSENDWLSIGYEYISNRLSPNFLGKRGGVSVNRDNNGLTEADYLSILGKAWDLIKVRIESELEKYKLVENGKEKYVSPARSIIQSFAKNAEEFKKELGPKSNEEKKDFIKVIMNAEPSEEVLGVCGEILAKIDHARFLSEYSNKPWAQPYVGLAAKTMVEKDPGELLIHSGKQWAQPYIESAANKIAESDPGFIVFHSEEPWAKPHLDFVLKRLVGQNPNILDFLVKYFDRPWVQPYIGPAAKNYAENNPGFFISRYSDEEWAKPYLGIATNSLINNSKSYIIAEIISEYSDKTWFQPYLDSAAKKLAFNDYDRFIYLFSNKPWAKPYIEPPPDDDEEGYKPSEQAYVDLEGINPENKEASSKIKNKLLKLSKILKSNNLEEYSYLDYYIRNG